MSASPLHFSLEAGHFWKTTAVLPSWKGFQSRRGSYGSQDQPSPSDGNTTIVFAPEGRGIEPLSDSEVSAALWVIENEYIISSALINALYAAYPQLQQEYGYESQERADLMPDICSPDDLQALIGLYAVNIHQVQKDGIPYAGFEFGCTWDEEHGLGILMHGTRTVDIGGADTAFLLWVAKRDGGLPLSEHWQPGAKE